MKFSFYCSGKAQRILNFYQSNSVLDYPVEFVYYDGGNLDVYKKLEILFGADLIVEPIKSKDLEKKRNLSEHMLSVLRKKQVDYVFCFGNQILKGDLLEVYKMRIINFHPSLLPLYPGLNSIDQAIEDNAEFIGNTAHFIDEGIDTGPIIMQNSIHRSLFKNYDDVLDLQLNLLKFIWNELKKERI